MMKSFNFFLFLFLVFNLNAQVTIGDLKSPESFSILELVSDGKSGLRIPQLTNDERDDIVRSGVLSGNILAEGLVIYNKDNKSFEFWNGTQWVAQSAQLSSGSILAPAGSIQPGNIPGEIAGGMPPSGGYTPYSYEWQYCPVEPLADYLWRPADYLCSLVDINKPHYQPCALNNTAFFRRKVTDFGGASAVSNAVKISVDLQGGTLTQPAPLNLGGGITTISEDLPSSGGKIATTYQWEYCVTDNQWYAVTDPAGGYVCSNAGDGKNYVTGHISTNTKFRRLVSDGEQSATSNVVVVTVSTALPKGTANNINFTLSEPSVCAGSPVTITAMLTVTPQNPVVYLYDSMGQMVTSVNAAPFEFTVNPADVPSTNYYLAFKGSNYDENLSGDRKKVSIAVTKNETPTIKITSTAKGVNVGEDVTFTATVTHGGANPQYIWRVNNNIIQGAISNTYTTSFSIVNQEHHVTCELISNESCVTIPNIISNKDTVTVVTSNFSCTACEEFLKTTTQYRDNPDYRYGMYSYVPTSNPPIITCTLMQNPMGISGNAYIYLGMASSGNYSIATIVPVPLGENKHDGYCEFYMDE